MARKSKGTYTEDILRIVNTPPDKVVRMPPASRRKYQDTLTWYRQQEREARRAEQEKRKAARAEKAARAVVIRAEVPARVSLRQVAGFLWGWDIRAALRPFAQALSWLVQWITEAFVSADLLPVDHPARTLRGASVFTVRQILREAQLNLPSWKEAVQALRTRAPASGLLSVRQYAVFLAVVGLLITAGILAVKVALGTFFGAAYALAASDSGGGMGMGSFTPSGDLVLNFLDSVFGGPGSTISAGLGSMFAMYSNMVLIFAGLILLWIVISTVAESARSGIPMGRHFNHVWAPIRLIIALGLLVPLSSGLGSGQSLVLALARWGSNQASAVWSSFADHMMIGTTTSASGNAMTTINGALNAVPLSLSSARNVAAQAFDMMLCEAMQNAYYGKYAAAIPNASAMMVSHAPAGRLRPILSQIPAGQSVVNTSGVVAEPTPAENVYTISFGRTVDDGGKAIVDAVGNPTTDGSCGAMSIKVPTTSTGVTVQSASDLVKSAILTDQSNDLANLVSPASAGYQLAQQVANSAVAYVTGAGTNGTGFDPSSWGAMTKQNLAAQYKAYVDGYVAQRTKSVAAELTNYGAALANNLGGGSCAAGTIGCSLQSDTKTYGWASASMWLNMISDQNGRVMAVLDSSTPVINASAAGPTATGDGQLMDAWNAAREVEAAATDNTGVGFTPTTKRVNEMMTDALRELTKPSANPLGDLPAIGRDFMATGVRLIAPPNVATCLNDPSQTGCDWVLADAVRANGGGILTPEQAKALETTAGGQLTNAYRADLFQGDVHGTLLPSGSRLNFVNQLIRAAGNDAARPFMAPVGLVLVSFGLTLGYILAFLPYTRFMLGVLNWMMQLFEALLGVPLLALRLLRTDGEGFAPQEFMSGVIMILGLILRPVLLIFGLVASLLVFNGIYQIVATTFLPAVLNLSGYSGDSDDSIISTAAYIIFYGTFAYTLGNSAFKLIDLLPNFVIGWIGQRGESRTDDASVVQSTATGYMQTLAYGMPRGFGRLDSASGSSGQSAGGRGNGAQNAQHTAPGTMPSATGTEASLSKQAEGIATSSPPTRPHETSLGGSNGEAKPK